MKAKTKKAPKAKTVAVEEDDLEWMIATLVNANAIIMIEGLDDDEEGEDIKTQVEELKAKYGVR